MRSLLSLSALLLAGAALIALPAAAQSTGMPKLVEKNGHYALMVDGAPYLMLAGQANNSSNYPAVLPKVWPAIAAMHANTLVMPVAWEQVEPVEGQFDFSFVDTLIQQAREHNVRLDILWFGTWKNTGPSYTPAWVKLDNKRFPRLTNKDGSTSYALSPHYVSTREADKKAYVALLNHIKAVDGDHHTVIIIQPENEVGVYGSVRDYSPVADKLMNQPVPDALIRRMKAKALRPSGNWHEVFGPDADEFFHAWSIAAYVDDIVAAGKAVYPLPTYMNDALKDPINPQAPGSYASGGPTWNVLDIYKVAAPHVDILAPDLYSPGSTGYEATLNWYTRPDNPLFVAETSSGAVYARYLFTTLGHGGIGFDPFGFDFTGYANYPLGTRTFDAGTIAPFARVYGLFAPMAREWARLNFDSQVWGVSEPDDHSAQSLDLGPNWSAKVTYRQWQFGMPEWDKDSRNGFPEGSEVPSGGVAVARLSDNEFLVTGVNARITFVGGKGLGNRAMILDRVEEGHFVDGKWVFDRVWNGDETDYGLNFTTTPTVLKVRLGSYVK